jgi:hypothetical protein
MSRTITLIRPLVAALAIVALAASAASAAPIDVHSPGHPSQHVRSAHAKPDSAVYWSYEYQAPNPKEAAALAQERAYSSFVAAPDPKEAGALAQERAYSSFVKAPPIPAAARDDDTPWPIIGLGITGAVLALLAASTVVVKIRVRRAQRVAV